MPVTGYEKKAEHYCLDFIEKEILDEKELSFSVATDSMTPLINPLDRVVVESCPAEDLVPGEIVLFRRGSTLCVHRYIQKQIHG